VASADRPPDDVLGWLLDQSHELAPGAIDVVVARALSRLGARSSCVYLTDHDQLWLHPFGTCPPDHESQPVSGTIAGRSFALQRPVTVPNHDGVRLWVPLVDGTARLGTLAVDLAADDAERHDVLAGVQHVASLAAELIISKARYTDAIELARRRQPMSLEAEMQRVALPPEALVTDQVAIAGILLPAYEVAGDSYDYALNDDRLHVAVIDSVGHDLGSSMVSHLVCSALRNARRNGLDLDDAYHAADAAVRRIFPDLQFATAAFGHLDVGTGRFRWVSAGHPHPLVVRDGRVIGEAPTTPALPIGLNDRRPVVNEVALESGDALLLYTDGVTECGVRGRERFGLDRLIDHLGRGFLADLPPPELVRRLATAVLEHSAHELRDDTTLLLVHYRKPGA
jgi:serine phosphatase RsbU (regulator of sigma subunit)